jgi:hypothetical protein
LPPHGPSEGPERDAAFARLLVAAREAWGRLGHVYLAHFWNPEHGMCFAEYAFGDPDKPRKPRRTWAELRAAYDAIDDRRNADICVGFD